MKTLRYGSRGPEVIDLQNRLNAINPSRLPILVPDGLFGAKTTARVKEFQVQKSLVVDGIVGPKTWAVLQQSTSILPLGTPPFPQPQLPGVPGLPPMTPPSTGPNVPNAPRGASSWIRQRFMAICNELLPPYGTLTNGQKSAGAVGTGCGEFPGRVFRRVPVPTPEKKEAFKIRVPEAGNEFLFLTSPMTAWEQFAKAVDRKYAPLKTWIPFSSNRPLPGDIYITGQHDKPAMFQHVGIIVNTQDDNEWTVAGGGQGNGWQSGFGKGKFYPENGTLEGESGHKSILRGWVDLDTLYGIAEEYKINGPRP